SGLMPPPLTILNHLPRWTLQTPSNSFGELEDASKPTMRSLELMTGSSTILRSSLLICVTIAGGVLAGATIPAPQSTSKPVIPASSIVGSSGNSELRCRRVTASARRAPDLTCGRPDVRSANIIDTRPASTSWMAGGVLLWGTCSMLISAQCASVSPATMPEGLALANDSLPGLGLAYSINSLTVLTGKLGFTTSISVKLPTRVTAVKSLTGSWLTFFIRNGTAESGELVAINSV